MNEAEPAVSALAYSRHVAVGMGVLESLADARHPKGDYEEREWRGPGTQCLCGDLD